MSLFKEKLYKESKRLKKHIRRIIKSFDKNVLFSIGENCLADDILARNGLKSFSSPYASGRSNIEYLLAFENEGFKDFLNPEYLVYENTSENKVARNKKYVGVNNSYHKSCTNGFEFTHHDVIGDNAMTDTIRKRCRRMTKLRNKNIVMLYHHRYCQETDEQLLLKNLSELAGIYKSRKNRVNIYMFTQIIVHTDAERKAEHYVDNGINVYKFHTCSVWGGDNEEILWARCDNDLLREMIEDIKKKLA